MIQQAPRANGSAPPSPERVLRAAGSKSTISISTIAKRHRETRKSRRGHEPDIRLSQLERRVHEIYCCIADNIQAGRPGVRAEEWLLDNRHLVQENLAQIRQHLPRSFLRQLPLLISGPEPVPRIQELALHLVRHGPQPLDVEWLEKTLDAYQSESVLRIGELWALPGFLRLAILRDLADAASSCLDRARPESPAEESPGDHPEEVAAAILSLRHLGVHDWRRSFEALSRADRLLAQDPAEAYAAMDFASRNRYRGAIEELSRGSGLDEAEVARRTLQSCRHGDVTEDRKRHVGYHLVGDGRYLFEKQLGYRLGMARGLRRAMLQRPALIYFGLLGIFALPPLVAFGASVSGLEAGLAVIVALIALAAVPILGLAVALTNGLIAWLLPARVLPRMSFDKGVPPGSRTAVVMPVLLASADDVDHVLERIEINYLNNSDKQLVYAILSDFTDAGSQTASDDENLLERASQGVRSLNGRHGSKSQHGPFLLLHRDRRWNPVERLWMGWERKRGKLVEFNRLLAGDTDTGYQTWIGDRQALRAIRYVITLDADTHMPPGAARRLIGTLAHPLNRAVIDPDQGAIRAGYGILQPRLEVDPDSTGVTRFTSVFAGDTRVDLYTHAVSDVYQDLFGEGIFAGKGIYDWRAFEHALAGRIPDNILLSHDLLEGLYGRVGLVSDTMLLEQFPPNAPAFMRRLHRWLRGDWQLLPWLSPWPPSGPGVGRRQRLPLIHRWKMLDNLRRSLQAPAIVALLLLAWLGVLPGAAWGWTLLIVALHAAPVVAELLDLTTRALADPRTLPRRLRQAPAALGRPLLHWLLTLTLLPYESQVTLDAIGRTLYRLTISRRRLLEWTPTAHIRRTSHQGASSARLWGEMWASTVLALTSLAAVWLFNPSALAVAAPILLTWLGAPAITAWTSGTRHRQPEPLSAAARRRLRGLARRTWLFFERFVGPDDHWLAPDNYQEEPKAALARRTSPTNIGLALTATLAAYDFGYIDPVALVARLRYSFETLTRMERYRGHWLNWYATRDLRPLEPRYVSTVDSGNLAASLLTLARGLEQIAHAPVTWQPLLEGIVDTLDMLDETLRVALTGASRKSTEHVLDAVRQVRVQLRAALRSPDGWRALDRMLEHDSALLSEQLLTLIEAQTVSFTDEDLGRLRTWLDELRRQGAAASRYRDTLLPWLGVFGDAPQPFLDGGGAPHLAALLRSLHRLLAEPPRLNRLPDHCRAALAQLDEADAVLDSDQAPAADNEAAREWTRTLRVRLERTLGQSESLLRDIPALARQADRWLKEMDFRFLYDRQRNLFRIGFNVSGGSLDSNHYDLLASEARLTGFIAIAKGDVPLRHWLHLGRSMRRYHGRVVLMSWSATLFEYLMPRLFMAVPEDSLLDRGCRAAIAMHRDFGARLRLPWGVSESGYYQLDQHQHYQYRAFGVPGLGFRSDLGDRVVVAPYATAMALPFATGSALDNIEHLCRINAAGPYGLYEAIDYGRTEKASPRRARVVRSYMSHHQGMILLALDNLLNDDIMLRRFHADRRIAGVSTLLHERPPPTSAALRSWKQRRLTRTFQAEAAPGSWPQPVRDPAPGYTLLSNGHYSLLLNADGGGGSSWDEVALVPWQSDRTGNAAGHWFYVKDLDDDTLFSLTMDPIGGDPAHCSVLFGPHMAEFQRRENGLFCRMAIALASQHDVEARRLTIRNESDRPRRLLLSEFAELALAPGREYLRHPAFARLFVESQCLEDESIVLFRRRPRGSDEKPLFLAHTIVVTPGIDYRFGWDTDRGVILGRGGRAGYIKALHGGIEEFSGSVGPVLDPAIGTGVAITLAPYARVDVGYLTAVGRSRRELLATLRSYRSLSRLDWIFEQARMQTGQELHNLEIDPDHCQEMQRLLSAILTSSGALRAPGEELARARDIQSKLWASGISGDWPIGLVQLRDAMDIGMIEPLIKTHTFWCGRQARFDLVVIDEQAGGYAQPTRDRLKQLIGSVRARTHRKLAGEVIVIAGAELQPEQRLGLLAAAQVVLDTGAGPFADQLRRPPPAEPELPPLNVVRASDWQPPATPPLPRPAGLSFDNGLGGFSADGREYLLHLSSGRLPPAPWSNVIANPGFGCLVTETGSSCTWAGNSSEQRLTPWSNDPAGDRSGETVYLRDEETGAVWTPTPRPIPTGEDYQVRHGAGYSEFVHHSHGLIQSLRIHVDPDAPVKLCRLTLTNAWSWTRRITATCYAEWVLGTLRADSAPFIVADYDPDSCALLARNSFSRQAGNPVAFLTASLPPHGLCTDRTEFLGRGGGVEKPAALGRIGLSGRIRPGDDPCAAYQVHLDIPAGETISVYFILGQGEDRERATALAQRFRLDSQADASWERNRRRWRALFDAIQVETPEPAMDLLLNQWLPYQALTCRLWGRSGYYQSSGAFGFRDQLQDVMALTWAAPEVARAQIARAASRQFQDGDVLHWWHEAPLRGVRTRCSDDLLWLPFVVAHFERCTGDDTILRESASYLAGPPLQADESEHYTEFQPSVESGSIYEHCCRAIDRASTVGPHGMPTIGSGDWNDGFNRVSTTGRGESVWLAWFLARVCDDFAPCCERQGDAALAERYRLLADEMRQRADAEGWDGQWYRRAYFDDGTPLGSSGNDECRIDLIAQTWSVFANDPPTVRARQAMVSAWQQLVREDERLIVLLAPPFDRTGKDPGYIKGYPPGIRENGGQYTHAATWAVWAFARLGDGDRAMRLFQLLNPILRTATAEQVDRYRVEPYVLAGDIYSIAPNTGRGGWTWYSGAAGWLYRAGIEALLGLKQRGDELELSPCLPADWPGYRACVRRGGARYRIGVANHAGGGRGEVAIVLDDRPIQGCRLPFVDDGQTHQVEVTLSAVATVEP